MSELLLSLIEGEKNIDEFRRLAQQQNPPDEVLRLFEVEQNVKNITKF